MTNIIGDLTSVNAIYFLLAAIVGYLIGSVNLSIIISKSRGKDIREMGSGNAGSTNTLRTMGKGTAAAVLVFDILKGCLIPLIIVITAKTNPWIYESTCHSMAYIYAVFAVVGHCFPLYYGFKGGKGIATAAGALLVISPLATVIAIAEFVVLIVIFRYVSLASVVAAINVVVFTALILPGEARLLASILVIVIIAVYKHKTNILKLRNGEESTMFYNKK